VAKTNDGRFDARDGAVTELVPAIPDGALAPVHVLGVQVGDIGLGAAQVPQQLVEVAFLGVAFAGDDPAVFVQGDAPLPPVHHGRPLPAWDHRFQEPVHAEGEVVD